MPKDLVTPLFKVKVKDIESVYEISNNYYIFPRGKFHLYSYSESGTSITLKEIIPEGFSINGNWDLKCFFQFGDINNQYFFISYLTNHSKFYYKNSSELAGASSIISSFIEISDGFYDYKWTTTRSGYDYYMNSLITYNNNIVLQDIKFN